MFCQAGFDQWLTTIMHHLSHCHTDKMLIAFHRHAQTSYNARKFHRGGYPPQERGAGRWHELFWDLGPHIARS